MSSTTHISPTQDTGGNVNYLPNSCNISDISMISVYWSDIMNKPGFCNVSITGSYNDLLNVPSLSTVAFSGDYNSLSNRPWINSNSNIYNNNQGNVGIGTNNPTEKLHLVGNFSISGDIIPAINSNFNLGSSNYKWKDLYLSGNSIYLDNLIISKNSFNNLEIRDSDNNLRSISLNQLELNDGDNKLRFLYSNGALIFNSNGINIQGVEFSNYSKIIYSNNLYTTSNTIIDYTNYRINNLNFNTGGASSININTDTIQIGTSNKFITSNIYDSNITFMNNLNVNGSYQLNNCNVPFSLMKFTNITTTNGVFTYNASSNDFGYFSFVNSGTITFPQTTACDVLVVGAGGNGGTGTLSGGGGAGEVIAYPSYSFPSGTYTIQVGTSGTSSNNRISKINSNSIDLLNAKGGADGISLGTITCNTTSNLLNYGNGNSIIVDYNYSNLLILPDGNSNFLFTGDGSIVTNSRNIYSSISGINPSVWYKFDNNTNLGLDEYGNQNLTNNLTVLPTTNSIKGMYAAEFSTTTNNYLSKTSSTPAINSVNFTISFWFMIFSNARMGIFTIGSSSTTRAKTGVQILSTSALYIKNYGDDYSVSYPFNLNTYYHFTMTFNTSSPYTQKIYINGILIKQYNLGGIIVTNTSQFDIGRWNESGTTYYFNGIIDDFRIYNGTEISASQVLELFDSSVNRSYPILKDSLNQTINPLAWLKFDDSINVGKDDMGVYNYSINNVSTYSTYPAKGNSSASFNGTNSYLTTSAGVNLNNKSFSFCIWVYPISLSTSVQSVILMRDLTVNGATNNNRLQIDFRPSSGQQKLNFGFYGIGNDTVVNVDNGAYADKWSHIVCTYNVTAQTRKIYGNGVLLITANNCAALNEPDQRHVFGVEKNDASTFSSYFNGYMDDIRFYDFELSLAQIQELYQGRIRFYNVNSNNIGGSGGGSYANVNQTSSIGSKWDSNYSYLSSGYIGTANQGGNGGGALSNIGLTTSLVTGSSLTVGEGGTGATLNSTPILKTNYGSGGDGNGGTGTNGLVIVKVPLNTCNVKFDGFIYSSNIFDLNYNTITLMSLASNQLNSSIIATSNKLIDYDNLIDKPWINSNLIIYNNNQGNVGIGTNNPTSKLDVSGDINFTGSLRLNQRSLPFSVYSNTNILTSNGLFSYIPNNVFFGYYTFLTNGTITFPQTTLCDIIVVGAGGNGGTGILTGGGGAGEVIAYSDYSFATGTYGIQVGTTNDITSSNLRRSIITSNNTNLVTANGGGDGAYNFFSISGTGSVFSSNVIGSTTDYYITFTSGSTTITLIQNLIIDILVIGGGGGGASRDGGGGGAGALIYKTNYTLASGVYTIAIGAGGAGGSGLFNSGSGYPSNYGGQTGSDTTITNSSGTINFRAKGGGGGAFPNVGTGGVGGCNGGNTAGNTTAQPAVSTQNIPQDADVFGNKGGVAATSSPNPYATPGGGGTGGVGLSQAMSGATVIKGGDGGIGKQIPITGSNLYYGGGGGGGCFGSSTVTTPAGDGGLGGGGAGSRTGRNTKAGNATPNTGGGGGGGGFSDGARINGNDDNSAGGDGGSGVVIIRYSLSNLVTAASSGGSGGGGLSSSFSNMIVLSNAAVPGAKWNPSYSYSTSGSNGTLTKGGNGGSALSNIGYTETITSNSFVLGVGGIGATSNSVPSLKTTYGSGGDGNGGLGTQGIVIIKVPLNIQRPRFDGYINYSNIDNRPVLNDLLTSTNYLNIGYYNQVNFPLGDVSWNNEWFLYIGRSPTSVQNSFIFWHLTSNINSKWWFNGTQTSTNNEISDARIKKEITEIQNPLDKLMLIKPKEYYLCDEKDYLKKYGIIAQDVASNQELSHLVYKDDDFIANVYTTATYVSSPKFLLITTTSIIGKVAVDDELKLLLDNMNIENIEIIIEETPYHNRYKKRYVKVKEIIDEFTIEIYEEIELSENEKSNILIYGKKVNDFNKLDYSSLYSLNIACTQELYKIIQEQKNKIDELEQRIIQLENR